MTLATMFLKMGEGFGRTCAIFFLTLLFSLPLGMVVALLRMSKNRVISGLTRFVISILVQKDGSVQKVEKIEDQSFTTAILTLGTNHIYRLKETGEIVDNCQKRPQSLFTEEELSVEECVEYLMKVIETLCQMNPDIRIVLTVSPIRYRKYGYHGSQLSKALSSRRRHCYLLWRRR